MARATKGRRAALLDELGQAFSALLTSARAFSAQSAEGFQPPLSSSAFQILQWLHSHGPSRANELADGLAMDRSVISRLLKQLRALKLIEAMPAVLDRRGVVVKLHADTQVRMDKAMSQKGRLLVDRFGDWSATDIETLLRLMQRINGGRPKS